MIGREDARYRVWHIPQVPGQPFLVPVDDLTEAVAVMAVLADYDRFQLEERIKPDYANAQGVEHLEDSEWCEVDDELVEATRAGLAAAL